MKLKSLLLKIFPFLIIFSLIFIGTTTISHLDILPNKMAKIFKRVDLRLEGNLATWFQSVMFLFLALTYFELWAIPKLSSYTRKVSLLFALIFIVMSSDESATIHEDLSVLMERSYDFTFNQSETYNPFSWIFIYAPLLLLGFTALYWFYNKYTSSVYLLGCSLFFSLIVILMEWKAAFIPHDVGLEVLEESSELAAILFLTKFNLNIINNEE